MACLIKFFLIFSLNFLTISSLSHNPILPKAAIVSVTKDSSTHQYVAKFLMGENLVPVKLVVDLNGHFLWADCESDSSPFSSHHPVESCSLHCSMAKSTSCFSNKDNSKICTLQAENTVSRVSSSGALLYEDKIGLEFFDGINSGSIAKTGQFLFSCAPNLLLKGLVNGAKGMLGLGNSRISVPSQISTSFGFFDRKFSLCLSKSTGAILFGGNFYESEISSSMIYTPLVSNKNGYYINVNSIKISDKKLSLVQKGAKISTVDPYTTMETKIFGKFMETYVKAAKAMNLTLVPPPVAPFQVCFSSKGVENKSFGPNVPILDIYLQSEMVKWRIFGRNMMVPVNDEVMCLGFLDGGSNPKDSIVIGAYQLEDYLVEFNLGSSMLGLSSSLSMGHKKCSDFEASAIF